MSLELLTRQREPSATGDNRASKTSKPLPSWFVPAVILAGFAAIFTIVLWDDLQPSVKVTTARAIAIDAYPSAPASDGPAADPAKPARLLFQAAGWLEPDPMPVKAGVLINGTIARLPVNEGQLVRQGDILAELDADEYRIAVDQSHAAHMEAEATIRLREAEIRTANARLKTEEASLAASLERTKRAKISYDRYAGLKPDTVSAQTITDAEQELREQEKIALANEAKILAAKTALEEARARLDSAIAVEKHAEQACNKARLDLRRCVVKSPIDGRILRLSTSPGARVNALADDPDSGLVAILYDPASIALKMDVPLDQAGKLTVGLPARVRCEVFPDRVFEGIVTRVAGEADIQRNTLQARVRLTAPDDKLRPGMACRAEVYTTGQLPAEGSPPPSSANQAASGQTIEAAQPVLIPAEAIDSATGLETETVVWSVSLRGKLERRAVRLDPSLDRDGLKAVSAGLLPGEPVVILPAEGLREGAAADIGK